MLSTLRRHRIEIKYLVIALIVLAGMGWLASHDVFDPVEGRVNEWMDTLADYGLPGMFVIGMLSNMTLVIQVPYVLPMFPLVVYMTSLEVVALGTATGIGAGIGETISYAVAHTLVARVEDLEKSALFRWTRESIERRPHVIPFLLWFVSAVPIPDLAVIVPLAMINYPWRKLIIPMITGKIFQNTVVALIFKYAADRAEGMVSRNINFDLTAIIVVIFLIVIAYQIESTRAKGNQPDENAAADEAAPVH